MSTFYFFPSGIAAFFPRSWRLLYVVTSLPSLDFAVLPFGSKSPRWYLLRRHPDDALRVIRTIATTNSRVVPDPEDVTLKLDDEVTRMVVGGTEMASMSSCSIVDVFRSPTTRVHLMLSVLINNGVRAHA